MARQSLGAKKVRHLRAKTGLDVVAAMVRGGTDHRIDLCLADGSVISLHRDGSLELNRLTRHTKTITPEWERAIGRAS